MHNPAHLVANSDPAAPQELFALTDEQILEIDPETNGERNGQETSTSSSVDRKANDARTSSTLETAVGAKAAAAGSSLSAAATVNEPPRWLAEMMGDPNRGGEAEDFWQGVTQARQEAAAYREVFAKPEEARAAAQRARALDEIDRAYFGGNPGDRAQLVATMMREDTAAFREMVVEGLRALEEAEKGVALGMAEATRDWRGPLRVLPLQHKEQRQGILRQRLQERLRDQIRKRVPYQRQARVLYARHRRERQRSREMRNTMRGWRPMRRLKNRRTRIWSAA